MGDICDIINKISWIINKTKKCMSVPRDMTSASRLLAAQAWKPKSRSQHPCKQSRAMVYLQSQDWGIRDKRISGLSVNPVHLIQWDTKMQENKVEMDGGTELMPTPMFICTCMHPPTHPLPHKAYIFLNVVFSSWYFFVFKKLYATEQRIPL